MRTTEEKQRVKNSLGRGMFVGLSIILQVGWIVGLVMTLNDYYAAFSIVASLLALLVVLRIYGNHINAAYKMSWIILILLFPVFGLCLFVLCGHTGATAGMRHRFAAANKRLEGLLPAGGEALDALSAQDKALGNQARYIRDFGSYPVWQNTDVEFYPTAEEGIEAQKTELRKAENFIFMEYHAIEDSVSFRAVEDILAEKAAQGVDVRVFYDDMGSLGFINNAFTKRLESRGIRCRVFNPLLPFVNVFMNNRDHRKITVVDGKVGFTGGYNLADEYFNLTSPYGHWKDTGLKLTGDGVRSLTVLFLEIWNAMTQSNEDFAPFLPALDYTAAETGFVQPYGDSPLDQEYMGENVYLNIIKNAKDYVYLMTPYLIIDDEMQRELTLAAQRGVDVRIVTPGIPDKKLIYKVTRSYYAGLAEKGVRIYEYTPGFCHAKQFVADGEVAVVGTINLDYRSLYLHFENACCLYRCQAVAGVKADFDDTFPLCAEVTQAYRGKRSLVLQGSQVILRLFAPLM